MRDLSLYDELAEFEVAMAYLEASLDTLRVEQHPSAQCLNDQVLVPLRRVMARIIHKDSSNEAHPLQATDRHAR